MSCGFANQIHRQLVFIVRIFYKVWGLFDTGVFLIDLYCMAFLNEAVPQTDAEAAALIAKGKVSKARKLLTEYTVETAQNQFLAWTALEELLLVKFIDGNVKAQAEDGSFLHSEYSEGIPEGLTQPGYTDIWKEAVVKDNGEILKVR